MDGSSLDVGADVAGENEIVHVEKSDLSYAKDYKMHGSGAHRLILNPGKYRVQVGKAPARLVQIGKLPTTL